MNVLLLSRYSRLGASSRLRTMQYLPVLEREGIHVRVEPFFDDAYLEAIYTGKGTHRSIFKYMFERIRQLRRRPTPDLIWLEKEFLPWTPWPIERAILPHGVPVVSDYDDAVFHRYDKHRSEMVRTLLGQKISHIMAASDLVIAGNPYLSNHAWHSGAQRVEIIPTVVDLNSYDVDTKKEDDSVIRVGWIGTPQTWKDFAHPVHKVLDTILARRGALFRAVGASMQSEAKGTLEIIPWTEDTEVSLIQSMDIGVMPLPNTPWTRGKCGYKLIQYMACGLPVVASPVGVNSEIVEHGVNGFLADTEEDWQKAIKTLLENPDLRYQMGAAGRKKVVENYSLQVWGFRLSQILRSVVENRIYK